MIALSMISLLASAATPPPDAVQRVNATYTGLNTYYYNATGRHWNCCGQTGGAGGAAAFGCACAQAGAYLLVLLPAVHSIHFRVYVQL